MNKLGAVTQAPHNGSVDKSKLPLQAGDSWQASHAAAVVKHIDGLRPERRRLLSAVVKLGDRDGTVSLRQAQIAILEGISERTVKRAFADWQEAGWLANKGTRKRPVWRYDVAALEASAWQLEAADPLVTLPESLGDTSADPLVTLPPPLGDTSPSFPQPPSMPLTLEVEVKPTRGREPLGDTSDPLDLAHQANPWRTLRAAITPEPPSGRPVKHPNARRKHARSSSYEDLLDDAWSKSALAR